MPCIAVPDYDTKMGSLSLRTPVPSPASDASASGLPIAAVVPEVSISIPAGPVAKGPPMNADEITPAPVLAPLARAAPFPLTSVPVPVSPPPLPVLHTAIPASSAPSLHTPAEVISVPSSPVLSFTVAVVSPVLVPSPDVAVQTTSLPIF